MSLKAIFYLVAIGAALVAALGSKASDSKTPNWNTNELPYRMPNVPSGYAKYVDTGKQVTESGRGYWSSSNGVVVTNYIEFTDGTDLYQKFYRAGWEDQRKIVYSIGKFDVSNWLEKYSPVFPDAEEIESWGVRGDLSRVHASVAMSDGREMLLRQIQELGYASSEELWEKLVYKEPNRFGLALLLLAVFSILLWFELKQVRLSNKKSPASTLN